MNNFFKQGLRYFKPISGHGTVGMLQRFIFFSEWVLIISVIVSIILEFCNTTENNWIDFFENYAIGIACSDLIVLVTSIIQFNSERNKRFIKEFAIARRISISLYEFKNTFDKYGKERSKPFADELIEYLVQYYNGNYGLLYWYNKRINDKYESLFPRINGFAIFLDSTNVYLLEYTDIKEIIVLTYELGKMVYSDREPFFKNIVLWAQLDAYEEANEKKQTDKNKKEQ